MPPSLQRRMIGVILSLLWTLVAVPAPTVLGQADVRFGQPHARGDFGEAITFETAIESPIRPRRVELLTALPGQRGQRVSVAGLEQVGPQSWRARVVMGGHVVPNTTFDYRFRAVTDEGTVSGPEATHQVIDHRVEWRRLDGDHVRVWWYEGDQAFAERALEIAEEALTSAAGLLGVDDLDPVDFFIYADSRTFRQALGPATRENVGGEAHPDIRTLFGLIEPRQISSDWVEELVTHELAHLVFDEAVSNPYRYPPRWLNEGLAVYLSRGYDAGDQAQVGGAARAGTIIPLEGLTGHFPTRAIPFSLAYAVSVSAVDYFVETYGREQLAQLITSFADGRSVDAAFRSATGTSFVAFEDAWLASLGAERPEPYGPQPGLPGPMPDAWASMGSALLR